MKDEIIEFEAVFGFDFREQTNRDMQLYSSFRVW